MALATVNRFLDQAFYAIEAARPPENDGLILPNEWDDRSKEQRALTNLLRLLQAAAYGPNRVPDDVEQDLQLYRGEASNPDMRPFWWADVRFNSSFITATNLQSIEMDQPLNCTIRPNRPESDYAANVWRVYLNWLQDTHNWDSERAKAVMNGILMGTRVFRIMPDASGNPVPAAIDPRLVICDPTALKPEQARYIIEFLYISDAELYALDPEKAKNEKRTSGIEQGMYPGLTPVLRQFWPDEQLDDDDVRHVVARMWWFPEELGLIDHMGGSRTMEESEMLARRNILAGQYPLGRVTLFTENAIYRDEPMGWFGGLPFEIIENTPDTNSIYGISDLKNIRQLQIELNRLIDTVQDSIRLTGHPRFLVTRDSNIKLRSLTNQIGENILTHADLNNSIRPVEMPQLPNDVWQQINLLQRLIDTTTGVTDFMQGRTAEHQQTAREVEALMEMIRNRPRQKIRNMRDGVKRLFRKMIYMAHSLSVEPQNIRVSASDLTQIEERMQSVIGMEVTQGTGYGWVQANLAETDPDMDVSVDIGPSIAKSKLDHGARSDMYLEMGVMTPQEHLEFNEFPYRFRMIPRLDQQQAQMEMQTQMQAMLGGGQQEPGQGEKPIQKSDLSRANQSKAKRKSK